MTDATRNGFPIRYLGDGVYASFDGYQVWLHVGHHLSTPLVALERQVINHLNEYWAEVHKVPETPAEDTGGPILIDEASKINPVDW